MELSNVAPENICAGEYEGSKYINQIERSSRAREQATQNSTSSVEPARPDKEIKTEGGGGRSNPSNPDPDNKDPDRRDVQKEAAKVGGSLDGLSRAAGAADRGGLTKAGRALQKHGDRPGSAFPQTKGGPAKLNPAGQKIVDDILTNPGSVHKPNRFNGVDVIAPAVEAFATTGTAT